MSDQGQTDLRELPSAREKGPLLLAAGGVVAAFGAASCCALPLILGTLGLGSGWLVAVAWLAAPHRIALLVAATILLASGGGAFLRRRRVASCSAGVSPPRLVVNSMLAGTLLVGTALVVLGYLYV
jgi:mercuric ion transport protein